MHPILWQLGGFSLYSFGLMVALAMLMALLWLAWVCKQKQQAFSFYFEATLLAIIAGLVGARLFYFLYFPQELLSHGVSALLASGGLVWYGGLLAGALSAWGWLAWQRRKQPKAPTFLQWLDALVPGLALGLAFGRLGCFLAGCCYGAGPCGLPWAVTYPLGHPTHLLPLQAVAVHPSPLYEAVGALGLALLLMSASQKTRATGLLSSVFLMSAGLLRCFTESTRGDTIAASLSVPGFPSLALWGLSVSQVMSLAMAGLGLLLLLVSGLKGKGLASSKTLAS